MAFFSSKTLIQAHALFLFILAVYLTKSPDVITDSDLVFMLGEAMKIVCPFLRLLRGSLCDTHGLNQYYLLISNLLLHRMSPRPSPARNPPLPSAASS